MKKLLLAALLAILASGLVFVSCATIPTSEADFEGTWTQVVTTGSNRGVMTYTFSGFNFTFNYEYHEGRSGSYAGTYTFTDNTITFIRTEPADWGQSTWTQEFTMKRNSLTIAPDRQQHFNGTFKKQR